MLFRLTLIFLVFGVAQLCLGCKPRPKREPSPEMSKSMLKLRGYKFQKDDFFKAILDGDPPFINGFIHAGMDPNTTNREGLTALTYAIKYTNLKTVRVISQKADLNLKDDVGNSPLHLALSSKNDLAAKFLLNKQVDINVTGKGPRSSDQTPLHAAAVNGNIDFVKELLKRGADPNIADSKGSFPLSEATGRSTASIELVKMLVDAGADVNKTELNGLTPLIYAATNRGLSVEPRVAIVKYLLERGARKQHKDNSGMTALAWAIEVGHTETVAVLQ
jgi:ankyrin repeat protein